MRMIIFSITAAALGLIFSFVQNYDFIVKNLGVIYSFLLGKSTAILSYLIPLPIVLICEWLLPVDSNQKILSVSFVQDIVWSFIVKVFGVTVMVAYVQFLSSFYMEYLSFLTIETVDNLPDLVKLLWGILLVDFLEWLHHWIRHKVPWFWSFHVIHHAQRHMNMFTDTRYHVMEYIIAKAIMTFPLLMLGVESEYIIFIAFFKMCWSRFYHSNIRTSLGPFKYILVTPQSHRIHHSIDHQHRDMNFGVLFSFWDIIFRTQYYDYKEYPNTGVDEKNFPQDENKLGVNLILSPITQHIYPFLEIAKSFRLK